MNIHPFDYYALLFSQPHLPAGSGKSCSTSSRTILFVNRGVYRALICQFTASAVYSLILLFHRLRRRPVLVFVLSGLCAQRWNMCPVSGSEQKWGNPLVGLQRSLGNLDGHICLAGAVSASDLAALCLSAYFSPFSTDFTTRLTIGLRITLCILFLLVFIADAAYSAMTPNTGTNITACLPTMR